LEHRLDYKEHEPGNGAGGTDADVDAFEKRPAKIVPTESIVLIVVG
jgi:hypothetical protein